MSVPCLAALTTLHGIYFAEQDTMSVSSRIQILPGKTDTINYNQLHNKCFHLDTAVENILQTYVGTQLV